MSREEVRRYVLEHGDRAQALTVTVSIEDSGRRVHAHLENKGVPAELAVLGLQQVVAPLFEWVQTHEAGPVDVAAQVAGRAPEPDGPVYVAHVWVWQPPPGEFGKGTVLHDGEELVPLCFTTLSEVAAKLFEVQAQLKSGGRP